jgi:hypothetical protein
MDKLVVAEVPILTLIDPAETLEPTPVVVVVVVPIFMLTIKGETVVQV